jgi:fido (protein-threonine AMPylation protein)
MNSKTRAYVPIGDDPRELFQKAMTFFENIQDMTQESGEAGMKIVGETLTKDMANAIFGSNAIERAGLGLEETLRICEKIFRGETVDPEDIPEQYAWRIFCFPSRKVSALSWLTSYLHRDPDYEKRLVATVHSKLPASHIIRSRREVVQHALALYYIVQEMVVKDKLLSEEIILETHRILTSNVDAPGGASWEEYAGKYRRVHVHAGSTNFVTPNFVPVKMKELIEQFNSDIAEVEKTKVLDPFTLAAKYCNDFVMIHPFVDGNGRACRLILNAILLKYAGVVVAIGEHDESRAEYMAIQKRAGEQMEGSGELAALILKRATVRYRTLKQKLTGKKKK